MQQQFSFFYSLFRQISFYTGGFVFFSLLIIWALKYFERPYYKTFQFIEEQVQMVILALKAPTLQIKVQNTT